MSDGFEKVEENIFKFESIGDTVEGELLRKEIGKTYENEVYHILDNEGKTVIVFSTTVMQSRMNSVNEGDKVRITFTGTQPATEKGKNDLKLFDVFFKRK